MPRLGRLLASLSHFAVFTHPYSAAFRGTTSLCGKTGQVGSKMYIKVMDAFSIPSFILRRLNSMLATPCLYMRLTAMCDLPRSRFTSGGSALR